MQQPTSLRDDMEQIIDSGSENERNLAAAVLAIMDALYDLSGLIDELSFNGRSRRPGGDGDLF